MISNSRDKIFALIVGAIGISGCGDSDHATDSKKLAAASTVAVVVEPVRQKTVPIYTELTARTDANDSVEIRARVKAFLQTQNFLEGTMVKKGQSLFTLDSREYAAQLLQSKASLGKAEADLAEAREKSTVETAAANLEVARAQLNKADQDVKRLAPLAEQRAVPQQDYDDALAFQRAARADVEAKKALVDTTKVRQTASIEQALAAVATAKAAIQQADLNIEYCNITSPIHGIVGTRQVAPGNLVGSGEPTLLTTVSNVNPMRVFVSISESDYLKYQRMRSQGKLRVRRPPISRKSYVDRNYVRLRLGPDLSIAIGARVKRPGEMETDMADLAAVQQDAGDEASAYERLIFDAMQGRPASIRASRRCRGGMDHCRSLRESGHRADRV